MLTKLKQSNITEKHAKLLKLEPCTEALAAQYEVAPPWAGFKIPYFTPQGRLIPDFYRYRFWPESKPSRGFAALAPPSELRYVQPKGTELHVYMPPLLHDGVTWSEVMEHPELPLCITEGELKAACVCANTNRLMLGLGGVFSWMSRRHEQALIPILEQFIWAGRDVYIVFDSDRASKPMVQLAASRLATTLTARGAQVWDILIPSPTTTASSSKQGADDYIVAHGPTAFEALFEDETGTTKVRVSSSLELHRLNEEVAFVWAGAAAGNVVRYADALVMSPDKFTRHYYRDRVFLKYTITKAGEKGAPRVERAAEAWLEWPYRNRVAGVTYAPGQARITETNEFNVWLDTGVAPKRGDVAPFQDLLTRVFGDMPKDQLTWLLRWFAYPIQNPGAKLFSCLLLWSHTGGTGKNLLLESFVPVYGESNVATVSSRDLISSFNAWAEGKQFIIGDEIAMDDKRHTTGDLKSMLTSRTIRINRKGIEAYEVPDCANYALTSNDPISLTLDQGERRTFVWQLPETPLGDAYGRRYAAWLRSTGAAALKYHLLTLPLGDFSPTAPPPETEAKDELIAYSRSDVDAWAMGVRQDPEKYLCAAAQKFAGPSAGARSTPYSVYTPEDLMKLYDPEGRTRTSYRALGLALARAGFKKSSYNNGRLGSYRATFWILDPSIPHLTSTAAAKLYQEERPNFVPPSARSTSSGAAAGAKNGARRTQ